MKFPKHSSSLAGSALIMVLILVGVSILILAGVMRRTESVATLNDRNRSYTVACNAAEAAVEKVYSRMTYDFQSQGLLMVTRNLAAYQTNVPTTAESSYWSNFQFSDPATGTIGKTYVELAYYYSGNLPSAYPGLFTSNSPVYRIISNVTKVNSRDAVMGTAQEDVLLALVPLSNWAIFYNGRLEFTQCATMTVDGSVFANGDIYVGTSASLTFNDDVGTAGSLSAPGVDGQKDYGTNPSKWNTDFNDDPGYTVNKPSLTVSLNMTNSHFLIDIPPAGEDSMSVTGQQRLYNKAQMILVVTNSSAGGNPNVLLTLQSSINGNVPGDDPSKVTYVITNATATSLKTNLPFLSLNNTFYDQRERKTTLVTEVDVGQYAKWASTNSKVLGKFSASVGPTILYVADQRKVTSQQLPVIRLSDASQLPANDGFGFSVATPNPLYTWGNYNTQISGSNVQSTQDKNPDNKVPAALLSDSLTILSDHWKDSYSTTSYKSESTSFAATSDTTINAAIVTGTMPTTDTDATSFSGGVHNLPRLLEDWGKKDLWLNTSIIRLWDSNMATNQFRNPDGFSPKPVNPYYNAPSRHYTFDRRFLDPTKVAPGIPVVLFPLRFAWGVPPPGVTNYTQIYHN